MHERLIYVRALLRSDTIKKRTESQYLPNTESSGDVATYCQSDSSGYSDQKPIEKT